MLDVRELDVFYGGVQAIRNVTFSVQKGEVVSIVGGNGVGKSGMMLYHFFGRSSSSKMIFL